MSFALSDANPGLGPEAHSDHYAIGDSNWADERLPPSAAPPPPPGMAGGLLPRDIRRLDRLELITANLAAEISPLLRDVKRPEHAQGSFPAADNDTNGIH